MDTYLKTGLGALGDATRMAIFQKLAAGPLAVTDLSRDMPVTRPAVSQHLKVLKAAGLVMDSREGTRRFYRLDPKGVARLRAHLDQMWTCAMSRFEDAANKPEEAGSHGKQRGRDRRQKSRAGKRVH